MPPELHKQKLLLCSRCKSHVSSRKTTYPPKAFWNNLDPGPIPYVIQILTQPEVRLLSRIIPFVKVIKFQGLFGQYGFKGQSVLFAQDIFEFSEKLPTMLPRSPSTAGIIIVTEKLENLNITREYSIRREKVYDALHWLIQNNPLYKDVVIDNNIQFNEQDIVRVSETVRNDQFTDKAPTELHCHIPINPTARIIRASWNQADEVIII